MTEFKCSSNKPECVGEGVVDRDGISICNRCVSILADLLISKLGGVEEAEFWIEKEARGLND